jgi:uncharacterized protein YcgL (UPF0745 family)
VIGRRVVVFRSARVDGMYLFVDASERLERVPPALLARFGAPLEVMSIDLEPSRRLARADAADVLAAISARGFHLQMPPTATEADRGG